MNPIWISWSCRDILMCKYYVISYAPLSDHSFCRCRFNVMHSSFYTFHRRISLRENNEINMDPPNGTAPGSGPLPPEAVALATRMYNAAREGDMAIFEQALPAGLPANMTNEKGDTLVGYYVSQLSCLA